MPIDAKTPPLTGEQVLSMSSLALAHVGDAVFELLVRTKLACEGNETAAHLHSAAISMVNASAQAKAIRLLLPHLTEEEEGVYRRGRNAKVNSVPKNANVGDYHDATGLEALFGYLHLLGRSDRIRQLFELLPEVNVHGS